MVKAFFLAAIGGLVPFAFAVPSQLYEDYNLRFRRAIGDQCQAPDGTGTCQSTSECAGISYPTNLCPNDPKDVQVRGANVSDCVLMLFEKIAAR